MDAEDVPAQVHPRDAQGLRLEAVPRCHCSTGFEHLSLQPRAQGGVRLLGVMASVISSSLRVENIMPHLSGSKKLEGEEYSAAVGQWTQS